MERPHDFTLAGVRYWIFQAKKHASFVHMKGGSTVIEPGNYVIMDEHFNISIMDEDTYKRYFRNKGETK